MPHILDGEGHLRATKGKAPSFWVNELTQDNPSLSPLAIPQPLTSGDSFSLSMFPECQWGQEMAPGSGSELSVWPNKGFCWV